MGDPGRMCTSPITLFPSANAAVSSRDRGAPASPAQRLASEAVALRPGAFVRADEWSALRPEQQHLVRVVAALTSNNPPTRAVLARESAAVVHGIPVVGPYPAQTQFCLPGSTSGRRSRVSRTTAAPAGVEVVRMGGHPVTSLAQTLVDLACTRSLRSSLASLSWAARARSRCSASSRTSGTGRALCGRCAPWPTRSTATRRATTPSTTAPPVTVFPAAAPGPRARRASGPSPEPGPRGLRGPRLTSR